MDRHARSEILSRVAWYGPLPWTCSDGSVIPLIDYTGKVRLTFSSRIHGSPVSSQQPIVMELGGDKPVLEVKLDWPDAT